MTNIEKKLKDLILKNKKKEFEDLLEKTKDVDLERLLYLICSRGFFTFWDEKSDTQKNIDTLFFINILIKKGVNVNKKMFHSEETFLQLFYPYNHSKDLKKVIDILIKNGIDPNYKTFHTEYFLYEAFTWNYLTVDAAEYILNIKNIEIDFLKIIRSACDCNNSEVLSFLLKKIDKDIVKNLFFWALSPYDKYIYYFQKEEIVNVLKKYIDINYINNDGDTILDKYIEEKGFLEKDDLRFFKKVGAKTSSGKTVDEVKHEDLIESFNDSVKTKDDLIKALKTLYKENFMFEHESKSFYVYDLDYKNLYESGGETIDATVLKIQKEKLVYSIPISSIATKNPQKMYNLLKSIHDLNTK